MFAGSLAMNKLRDVHQHENRGLGITQAQYIDIGLGVTQAQYIDTTMDCMEDGGVFNKRYDKWLHTAANVLQDDGSRIVCRLKQTCRPTGADRKWVTSVIDVMILNYAVGLDVARDGTQCNTQGVWPCKLPIDSLPLHLLAMSPDLIKALIQQPRRIFPTTIIE